MLSRKARMEARADVIGVIGPSWTAARCKEHVVDKAHSKQVTLVLLLPVLHLGRSMGIETQASFLRGI